jgi:hypothetical protein
LEKGEPNRKGQWGPIYIPDAANIQPEFKHGMVVDSVSWGQGLAESATKPLPQTRIVRDMLDKVSQFSKAEDGESYLEEHFRRMAAMPVWSGRGGNIEENELLSLSFKIQYLSFLAEQMARISPLPEWKEISAVLKGADDPPVSWICFRHTRARDIDRRGAEALASLFGAGGAMQRLNIRRAAQKLAAKTPIIWGGYVDFNDTTKNIWLRGAINREATFFIHAVTSARGTTTIQTLTMTEARKALLLPSQPLLKWADGATTSARLQELAAMVPEVPMEVLPTAVPEWFPVP